MITSINPLLTQSSPHHQARLQPLPWNPDCSPLFRCSPPNSLAIAHLPYRTHTLISCKLFAHFALVLMLFFLFLMLIQIDSVAEVVEKQKSANDMVFIIGGVGPLHSDVSLAGVAKAFGVRLAPDEEFEEYLRHVIGDSCTGDRNEMAQLPEGITELLLHESLQLPLIKCQNVVILSATNVTELDNEWNCLLELASSRSPVALLAPFVSKHLSTTLVDVEVVQPLSKLCLEFPDVYVGCYRKARVGPLIINFVGKDPSRVELAVQTLCKRFNVGSFSDVNCG